MAKSTKRKITDDLDLYVISNVNGSLFFKNKDEQVWEWDKIGDEQLLSVRDIKEMKASQSNFLKFQWVKFHEEDRDILQYLKIDHFYKDSEDVDIGSLLLGDVNDVRMYIEKYVGKSNYKTIVSQVIDKAKEMYLAKKLINTHTIDYIENTFNVSIKEEE